MAGLTLILIDYVALGWGKYNSLKKIGKLIFDWILYILSG